MCKNTFRGDTTAEPPNLEKHIISVFFNHVYITILVVTNIIVLIRIIIVIVVVVVVVDVVIVGGGVQNMLRCCRGRAILGR